jgi:hypothetical protein
VREFRAVAALAALLIGTVLVACEPPPPPLTILLDPRITGRQPGQLQVAEFLATGGTSIIDPDGAAPMFEVPITDPPTLERCNFSGSAGLDRCSP